MDHYRETDINRFVMIGAATIVAIGVGFWGLRSYAQQEMKRDTLEAPWVVAARAAQGSWRPVERTLTAPSRSDEVQRQIARWRRENGMDAAAQ